MKESALVFDEIVNTRRAIRIYHETEFDAGAVTRSLKRAVLAPSSSNMQLWEFHRFSSPEKLKSISWCCLNQSTAKTAKEIVVVVARLDKWKIRAQRNLDFVMQNDSKRENFTGLTREKYYRKIMPFLYRNDPFGILGLLRKIYVTFLGMNKPMVREVSKSDVRVVIHKSVALAAQTFMLSMTSEGYDTCPVEGFDSKRLKKVMGLPSRAEISMVITCGKRVAEGVYGERFRVPEGEVVFSESKDSPRE